MSFSFLFHALFSVGWALLLFGGISLAVRTLRPLLVALLVGAVTSNVLATVLHTFLLTQFSIVSWEDVDWNSGLARAVPYGVATAMALWFGDRFFGRRQPTPGSHPASTQGTGPAG